MSDPGPCSHALVVDEEDDSYHESGSGLLFVDRRCLLCGVSYPRTEVVLLPLRERCREAWGLRGVRSPWSSAERAVDAD